MIIQTLSTRDIVSLKDLSTILTKLIERGIISYVIRNNILNEGELVKKQRGYFTMDDLSEILEDKLNLDIKIRKGILGPIAHSIIQENIAYAGDYDKVKEIKEGLRVGRV